jgi:phosphonate transport system substrate-binding protein
MRLVHRAVVLTTLFFSTATLALEVAPVEFIINEGVSYAAGDTAVREGYSAMAMALEKRLKRPVRVRMLANYDELRARLQAPAPNGRIALVHPTHIALGSVKHHQYRLLATSTGHLDYRAHFISRKLPAALPPTGFAQSMMALSASPVAKPLGVPDEDSITAVLTRSMLASVGKDSHRIAIKYSRFQDSMPWMIDNGFADVSVTASASIVKTWTASGGNVVARSLAVPIKNVIAIGLSEAEDEKVSAYLVGMLSSVDARDTLEKINLPKGFTRLDPAQYLSMSDWLLPHSKDAGAKLSR